MPKNKNERRHGVGPSLSAIGCEPAETEKPGFLTRIQSHWLRIGLVILGLFFGIGVMANNGWLPNTDPLSGKRTGWFGRELPKNAASSGNPLAAPLASATPQLSKEYIYAGSRLLAVEDANAAQLVSVSGQVFDADGVGLASTTVALTDPQNVARIVKTNSAGLYQFDNVLTGVTYTISVSSTHYRFFSQQVTAAGTLTNVNFTGNE